MKSVVIMITTNVIILVVTIVIFAGITAEELAARLDKNEVILLDVRPVIEYEIAHLPGARNMQKFRSQRYHLMKAGFSDGARTTR